MMKMIMAAAALMLVAGGTLIPTLAFANLGDTRAESEKRYGVGRDLDKAFRSYGLPGHEGIFGYNTQDYGIKEWFDAQGICEGIVYSKLPNTSFTTNEAVKLVSENGVDDDAVDAAKEKFGMGFSEFAFEWCEAKCAVNCLSLISANGCDFVYKGKTYHYLYRVSGECVGHLFYDFYIATPEGFKHL
jgi:hypothetical protein